MNCNQVYSGRPVLPINIAGYNVDQVSLYVKDIEASIQAYKRLGYGEWGLDTVHALDLLKHESFAVRLAFNYQILSVEFELIQILEGATVQIPAGNLAISGLSHFGFHVESIEEVTKQFNFLGFNTLSIIKTERHTGTSSFYNYNFIDTRVLGFISKLIQKRE